MAWSDINRTKKQQQKTKNQKKQNFTDYLLFEGQENNTDWKVLEACLLLLPKKTDITTLKFIMLDNFLDVNEKPRNQDKIFARLFGGNLHIHFLLL